ncbi:hypothetical protein F8388_018342 [Cannabis sativa]|uniref:Uncharacterized protein n=1 Tax=Cannabis sativa TaxID=3483 RepID=A0A7J6HG19_CANSA|nr:hypothetical protein F8388_018342 [Cannabis sativa]
MPKSQLQCYGELVYCVGDDLLNKCNIGESPIERFKAVLAWNFSTLRPLIFGVVPYNPILGETHHVSKGTLNVLVEQVSHHPSVTALYATDEKENIQLLWCQYPVAKFSDTEIVPSAIIFQDADLLKANLAYRNSRFGYQSPSKYNGSQYNGPQFNDHRESQLEAKNEGQMLKSDAKLVVIHEHA